MKKLRKWIKYLFPGIILVLLFGLVLSRVYQREPVMSPEITINAEEADEHTGKIAEVCGRVASTDYLPELGGSPTFINLVRPHPDQPFTAVIWGENRNKWGSRPDQIYSGRYICVTGKIELHEGKPQITVNNPGQITIRE